MDSSMLMWLLNRGHGRHCEWVLELTSLLVSKLMTTLFKGLLKEQIMVWTLLQASLQTWVVLGGELMLPLELHAQLVLLVLRQSLLLLLGKNSL